MDNATLGNARLEYVMENLRDRNAQGMRTVRLDWAVGIKVNGLTAPFAFL